MQTFKIIPVTYYGNSFYKVNRKGRIKRIKKRTIQIQAINIMIFNQFDEFDKPAPENQRDPSSIVVFFTLVGSVITCVGISMERSFEIKHFNPIQHLRPIPFERMGAGQYHMMPHKI